MSTPPGQRSVFRFAPSPNGYLHLGHALSAILNARMAKEIGGRFLLRIEDIDLARCKPEYEDAIYTDLQWLGLEWESPVRRQSEHIADYQSALDTLKARDLVYPAFMSRGQIREWVQKTEEAGSKWPRAPDGSPHYPPLCKALPREESLARIAKGEKHAWRLDIEKAISVLKAPLHFRETGEEPTGTVLVDPSIWGDVMLWRWDAPSSYHLSVVVDDSLQGVTHVVRGLDLFQATHIHRLLQHLLNLPEPIYHHHRLIHDETERKLSKSNASTAISALRQQGLGVEELLALIGLDVA